MAKNAYRRLLSELFRLLGPEWRKHGAALLLRRGGVHLIQTVSCQTSNFDKSYVVAVAAQVLARPTDSFDLVLGGRLRGSDGSELWLRGDEDPASDAIRDLIVEQGWPSIGEPLTLTAVARELDKRLSSKSDANYLWSAGLVYGLEGRYDEAQRCFDAATSLFTKLHKDWERSGTPTADWLRRALEELGRLADVVQSKERFVAHCEMRSRETMRLLRLQS
jgi:hypothetical protein